MILRCKCKNEYQDKRYGNGNRVHNQVKVTGTQAPKYRRTICCAVREGTK